MIALTDIDNCYCSFEQVMRPALRGNALVVLSSNDGCVVARTEEAKKLGVKMGAPWFKVRSEFPDADIIPLSANFEYYGSMSGRVMAIIDGFGHTNFVYSIDEVFSDLSGIRGDLTTRAFKIRALVEQWVGVKVGVGIGESRTQAKFANHVAKQASRKKGSYPAELAHVCNLGDLSPDTRDQLMDATDLSEIWGVGPRLSEQLRAAGLRTTLDVARMDPAMVRSKWGIVLEKTVRELQGVSCIDMDTQPSPRKEIARTRSFGHSVTSFEQLAEAITEFTSVAANKMRSQGQVATWILVFIRTSPFRKNDEQYSGAITVPLRRPTSDTAHLVQAALAGLQAIYKPGFNYAKGGIHLLELQAANLVQLEMDLDDLCPERPDLMNAMDAINARYGRGAISLASAGTATKKRDWAVRQEMRTPRYTTRLDEIPVALA